MNINELFKVLKSGSTDLSLSEKFIGGISIALLSMSIVFMVLIMIALIVKVLQKNKNTKVYINQNKDINTSNNNTYKKHEEIQIQNLQDENIEELVAVITGAICLATKKDSNKIVIKRISKNQNTKTNWENYTKP